MKCQGIYPGLAALGSIYSQALRAGSFASCKRSALRGLVKDTCTHRLVKDTCTHQRLRRAGEQHASGHSTVFLGSVCSHVLLQDWKRGACVARTYTVLSVRRRVTWCAPTGLSLSGLVCPSRTCERGREGDCMKEGEGEEGERVRERALGL